MSKRGVNVNVCDGLRNKLNFDNPIARVKYKTTRLHLEYWGFHAWIKQRNNTTDQLRKSIEHTKAFASSSLRHPFFDQAAIESYSERGGIFSFNFTPEV